MSGRTENISLDNVEAINRFVNFQILKKNITSKHAIKSRECAVGCWPIWYTLHLFERT